MQPKHTTKQLAITLSIFFFLGILLLKCNSFDFLTRGADSFEYEDAGLLFLTQDFSAHPTRMLGYSLPVGFFRLISNSDLQFYLLNLFFNYSCWLMTNLLLFKSLKLILKNNKQALFYTLLFTFHVGIFVQSTQILSEIFYIFLITFSIFFLIKHQIEKHFRLLLFSFLAFCLSILVRPTLQYFLIFIIPLLIGKIYNQDKNKVKKITTVFIIFVSTIGLQLVIMNKSFNTNKLSNIDTLTLHLYFGNYAEQWCVSRNLDIAGKAWGKEVKRRRLLIGKEKINQAILRKKDWKDYNEFVIDDFLQKFQINKICFGEAFFRNILSNSIGGNNNLRTNTLEPKSRVLNFINIICQFQNIIFSAIALLIYPILFFRNLYYKKTDFMVVILFLGVIMTIILSGISFAQGDRLHQVTVPIIIVLAPLLLRNISREKNSPQQAL